MSNSRAMIWKAWAPPKCKFFTWLLLQNRLWIAARLQASKWAIFCTLCVRNLEMAHHLFFECPLARSVWQLVASWSYCSTLNLSGWRLDLDLEESFSQTLGDGGKKGHTLLILILWTIWNWRSAIILRDR